ncbi:RNA polymerase sigma factor, partial [Armatimonas sp.]|uniref:RNA polymerase sigma factor n=1 Tax=Armatimonas sp. TaxID=1872638 RepID=UPI003752ACD6
MVPSDQELIARTQRGDNTAFGMLWACHSPRVLSLCQRMLATSNADPATDAQDITSETFIQALHALDQFVQKPGRASGFGPWLQEIARRRCLKLLERQRRRTDLLSAQPEKMPEASVAQQVEEYELLERVAQEINALPDTYRVPFRLMLEQFSHQEIAERLGLSVEAVVQRLHRARVRLRPRVTTFLGHAPHLRRMEQALSEIVTPSRIVTVQLPSGGEIQLCVRVDQRLASQASTLPERRRTLGRYPRAWKPWLVFAELAYHCGVWDEARLAYQETLTRNPACLPAALGLWEIL